MAAKRTRNAGLRAWRKSAPETRASYRKWQKAHGGEMTRRTKTLIGMGFRRSRIAKGANPNTGKAYTAKQLGLKGTARKAYRSLVTPAKMGFVRGATGGKGGIKRARRTVQRRYRTGS